ILMYHRIAAPAADPQLLCVSPENFKEHLDVLQRYWRPVSLLQLAIELETGGVRRRTVCVTFDDGYADNANTAAPLMHRQDIPATIFVVTGAVSSARPIFWIDELEQLVLRNPALPIRAPIYINGEKHDVHFG